MVPAFSEGPRSISLAWGNPVDNLDPAAARSLRVLGSNDFLAIWVVAVRRPIVVTTVAQDGTMDPYAIGAGSGHAL